MVEHDETRMQVRAQMREIQQKREKSKKGATLHLSVMVVQSIACCVVLLLVMLLRLAGGEGYSILQQRFRQALARNEWVSAATLFWDGNPLEKEGVLDVKGESFTEESLQSSYPETAVAALAPLADGKITSDYGERIHPISGAQEFHTGVDVAAPTGTALLAVYDGEVTEVGEDAQLGKYIRINYGGGIEIVYGHCEEIVAVQGALVRAGERVASVGSTGVSTGSHVHIRLNVDGKVCHPGALLPLEQYA